MSRLRWLVLALVAVGLVAAGCGDDGGGAAGEDGDPIRIGVSLPLTGEFSEPGTASKRGYEVWREMVNERGGLLGRPVELVVKDDASDQNTVVADYNALISRDRVDLLLGTFSSLLNLPASAVAERNQMLYVEPAGGAPEIFQRGFKFLFYSQPNTADHQGDLFAEYILGLPENERPKTAAYPTQDDPFAVPVLEGIREKLEPEGIKTVYKTTYPRDTANFDSIANAVKARKADLVVHGAVFSDGVGFVRALNKVGYQPKFLFQTSAPSHGNQYAKAVGEKNTEGIFFAVTHTPEARTPGNEEFVAKYKEMFDGELPAEDAADAFASGQVLEAAVKGVGSIDDQKALADWLRQNEVETVVGPLTWDETGKTNGEFLIGQWQDDKAEIVLPEESATSDEIVKRPSE